MSPAFGRTAPVVQCQPRGRVGPHVRSYLALSLFPSAYFFILAFKACQPRWTGGTFANLLGSTSHLSLGFLSLYWMLLIRAWDLSV